MGASSPGPAMYNVAKSEHVNAKHASSSRAIIGNSPRQCGQEKLILELPEPGPSTYDVDNSVHRATMTHSRSATFGTAPRDMAYLETDRGPGRRKSSAGPGPATYHVDGRMSSPRGTMGRSPRDTLEYIVGQDQAPAPQSVCGSTGSLLSPRVKGGFIGTSRRAPDPICPEPGPCTYEVAATERGARQGSVSIGNARRDTMQYIVKGDRSRVRPAGNSPGASKSRGAVHNSRVRLA